MAGNHSGLGRDKTWAGAQAALCDLLILGVGGKKPNLHVVFFKGILFNFYSRHYKAEPKAEEKFLT